MATNRQINFGPFFTATLDKTENKADLITKIQELKVLPVNKKKPKTPKIAEKDHTPVVINENVLKYEDSFSNLANRVNQHDVVKWNNPTVDPVFVERLIKPNSEYWDADRPTINKDCYKQRVKKLGDGSKFSDKITMLGIVEATFGG